MKVFSAVGSDDDSNKLISWIKLRDRLNYRKYDGMKFNYRVFEDETHTSAIPAYIPERSGFYMEEIDIDGCR